MEKVIITKQQWLGESSSYPPNPKNLFNVTWDTLCEIGTLHGGEESEVRLKKTEDKIWDIEFILHIPHGDEDALADPLAETRAKQFGG